MYNRSIRYRLYPKTRHKAKRLKQCLGATRFVWNYFLAKVKEMMVNQCVDASKTQPHTTFFSLSFGLLVVLLVLTGCQSVQSESTVDPDGEWVFEWDHLESRIIELTNQGLRDENPSELYHLKSLVENVRISEDDPHTLSGAYWLSVLNTNLVLIEQERGESSQVLHLLEESIELLEHTEFSVVERHALLAMLYRAKIEYDPSHTFELFSKMQDALDVAIEADSANLRVLLAQVFVGVQPVLGFSIDLDDGLWLWR